MEQISSLHFGKWIKPRKKRAVAEIIGSLMLVSMTVAGAAILTTFLGDSFVEEGTSQVANEKIAMTKIKLVGYDTRDSLKLMKLSNLDNQFNGILCGNCTLANQNDIPEDGGSEFVVIQIQNRGLDAVFLSNIFLNGIDHKWDSNTAGVQLDAEFTDNSGKYPSDGMFSIVPVKDPPIQAIDNKIQGGQTVNLIVKLGLNEDISISKSIRVLLNVGGMENIDFVIESGDAR